MKIGILSDSHLKVDYTKEAITFLKNKGVKYLIHAGDLCVEENLKLLKESNLPYVSVFGNNDSSLLQFAFKYNIEKEPHYFKIEDIKFKLMHMPFYLIGDTDVVIFGHTHTFASEYKNKTLFLNPGEVCAREKPYIEFALLEINENEYIIHHYSKEESTKNFKEEEIIYEREN